MIFLRSGSSGTERSIASIRTFCLIALIAYPAGALTLALAPDTLPTTVLGYGLILISLVCAGLLAGSSAQRIVAEQISELDEYELQLRFRAISAAYAVFAGLAMIAVIYAAIAADKGAWVPTNYEEYNGLFWGVFLYATVLPTACLAWLLDPSSEPA